MELKTLLTTQTGAARLGVSVPTFRNYRRSGVIRPIGKLGDVWVFDADCIDEIAKQLKPHKPFQSRLTAATTRIN